MNLARRISCRLAVAAALSALALACGGEPEATVDATSAPPQPPATPPAPAEASDPAEIAKLEALYEWDPTAGDPRDLGSDTAACLSQVSRRGLPGIAEHMQCMRARGWQTVQPRS